MQMTKEKIRERGRGHKIRWIALCIAAAASAFFSSVTDCTNSMVCSDGDHQVSRSPQVAQDAGVGRRKRLRAFQALILWQYVVHGWGTRLTIQEHSHHLHQSLVSDHTESCGTQQAVRAGRRPCPRAMPASQASRTHSHSHAHLLVETYHVGQHHATHEHDRYEEKSDEAVELV